MKAILSFVFVAVALFFWGCGPSGFGCSSPDGKSYSASIDIVETDSFIKGNSSISFLLCYPLVNYNKFYNHYTEVSGFPLLINYDKMIFQVIKNSQILDSIIIDYQITPKYIKKQECKDERFVASVKVNRCETTGHYFHIIKYRGYDGY